MVNDAHGLYNYCQRIENDLMRTQRELMERTNTEGMTGNMEIDNVAMVFPALLGYRISKYVDRDNRQLVCNIFIISCNKTIAKKLVYPKTNKFDDSSFKYWNGLSGEKMYAIHPFKKLQWREKDLMDRAQDIKREANIIMEACQVKRPGQDGPINADRQSDEIESLLTHPTVVGDMPVLIGGFRTCIPVEGRRNPRVACGADLVNTHYIEFVVVSYNDCRRLIYNDKNRRRRADPKFIASKRMYESRRIYKRSPIRSTKLDIESIDVTSMESSFKQKIVEW